MLWILPNVLYYGLTVRGTVYTHLCYCLIDLLVCQTPHSHLFEYVVSEIRGELYQPDLSKAAFPDALQPVKLAG